MAYRSYWSALNIARRTNGGTCTYTTANVPKVKPRTVTPNEGAANNQQKQRLIKGDMAPVAMVMGMVMMAVGFATHTAKQQLVRCPNVYVSKKRREIPEAKDPDYAAKKGDEFISKSFFRRVAHASESKTHHKVVPDAIRGDVYQRPRQVESLKSAGVEPASS